MRKQFKGRSVVHDRQRPAPTGQLTSNRDVGHHRSLASFEETHPPAMQSAVALIPTSTSSSGGSVPPRPHHRTHVIPGPVVPRRLDEQPPDMGVPGLGDRSLRPRGTRRVLRRYQPDERTNCVAGEPVPITDLHRQREPGQRVYTPQTRHPPHDRGELTIGSHLLNRRVQTSPARLHRQHVVVVGIEGHPRCRCRQLGCCHGAQPPIMGTGPSRTSVVDDAVAQQQLGQAMPRPHQVTAAVFTGPDQITGRFLAYGRDRHRGDLIQAQQPRQMQRVTGVFSDRSVFDRPGYKSAMRRIRNPGR